MLWLSAVVLSSPFGVPGVSVPSSKATDFLDFFFFAVGSKTGTSSYVKKLVTVLDTTVADVSVMPQNHIPYQPCWAMQPLDVNAIIEGLFGKPGGMKGVANGISSFSSRSGKMSTNEV